MKKYEVIITTKTKEVFKLESVSEKGLENIFSTNINDYTQFDVSGYKYTIPGHNIAFIQHKEAKE